MVITQFDRVICYVFPISCSMKLWSVQRVNKSEASVTYFSSVPSKHTRHRRERSRKQTLAVTEARSSRLHASAGTARSRARRATFQLRSLSQIIAFEIRSTGWFAVPGKHADTPASTRSRQHLSLSFSSSVLLFSVFLLFPREEVLGNRSLSEAPRSWPWPLHFFSRTLLWIAVPG